MQLPVSSPHIVRRREDLRSKEIAVVQVLFFFVVPIVLLYFHIIPSSARMFVLLVFSLLIYGVIRKQGWTQSDVGITTSNIRTAWPVYAIATIVAVCVVIVFSEYINMPKTPLWWTKPHFTFLFILVSFFQEFAFRGFLMPLLGKIFRDGMIVIVVNAALFALMHAIYPLPHIGLPLSFAGGLFFAGLYRKYPNLLLVTISHSVLNFLLVWYGFFTIAH